MKTADVFNVILQSGLLGVLLGLVVSGVKCAKTYIDTKTAESASKIKDTNINNAVNISENCVSTVVLEMAQTVVDDLKAKSADGKLSPDEIQQIKSDAINKVQTLISTDVYNTLGSVFGDANAWIKSKIEAAVKELKANTTPVLQSTAIAPYLSQTASEVPAAEPDLEGEAIETPQSTDTTVASPEQDERAVEAANDTPVSDACTQSAAEDSPQRNITINIVAPANTTPSEIAKQISESLKQVTSQAQ
jgi:hypothetical protein